MATLLLRLAAPLQSWGTDSKFDTRRTNREPSKSGVIGLLAAALGRRRDEPLDDLSSLNFGVRVDQEGTILNDFHTAKSEKSSYLTHRYYLEDAVFLVGLESEDELFLERLKQALKAPKFPLFLGRRSCPPDFPMVLGICSQSLLETLKNEPWSASYYAQKEWHRKQKNNQLDETEVHLRLIMDALPNEQNVAFQRDIPITFNPAHRQYKDRAVIMYDDIAIPVSDEPPKTFNTKDDYWVQMERR